MQEEAGTVGKEGGKWVAALADQPDRKLSLVQGTGLGCHLETASEPQVASLERSVSEFSWSRPGLGPLLCTSGCQRAAVSCSPQRGDWSFGAVLGTSRNFIFSFAFTSQDGTRPGDSGCS